METKEMLEVTIKGLQEKVDEITKDLQVKQAELEGINKPTMTENVYELLQDTIREAIDNTEFSQDDFDYELSMDYDRRVELDRMDFNCHGDLCDDIIRHIDKDFRVIENEENPTTDND